PEGKAKPDNDEREQRPAICLRRCPHHAEPLWTIGDEQHHDRRKRQHAAWAFGAEIIAAGGACTPAGDHDPHDQKCDPRHENHRAWLERHHAPPTNGTSIGTRWRYAAYSGPSSSLKKRSSCRALIQHPSAN